MMHWVARIGITGLGFYHYRQLVKYLYKSNLTKYAASQGLALKSMIESFYSSPSKMENKFAFKKNKNYATCVNIQLHHFLKEVKTVVKA